MFRTTVAVAILMLVCLVSPVMQAAAVDYFLKIDGIEGESTDAKHKEWIDIASFSWGATPAPGGSCALGEIVVVKHLDKSSPTLRAASGGRTFPQGILDIRGERHLLQGLKVKSIQPTTTPDGKPAERLTLSFSHCASGQHIPNAQLTARQAGPPPVTVGLLLPAVQKVRDAVTPPSIIAILIGLKKGPGTVSMVVEGGSEAANALQRAFQTQQKLDFLELTRQDQPGMKIKFSDVQISSFQTGGSGDLGILPVHGRPARKNFAQIQFRYSREEGNPAAFKDLEGAWSEGYNK